MVQNGKGVQMIGVSESHGKDDRTSRQKHVPLALQSVWLHWQVGPQQQHDSGTHGNSKQQAHCDATATSNDRTSASAELHCWLRRLESHTHQDFLQLGESCNWRRTDTQHDMRS